jgi:tRNA threonylcarbamoyladenosine biosynthesis protein TsaB
MVDLSRPWMLAIDTSAGGAAIALTPAGQDLGLAGVELSWPAARNQTATLLAQIDHVLRLCETTSGDIGAVAIAIGPGSFNALRVGLSTAKAFAFGLEIPIFGIGTLDAAAFAFTGLGLSVRAFVDAGRSRVVCGDYRVTPGGFQPRGELIHRGRDELADGLLEPTILAGELSSAEALGLAQHGTVVVPPASARRRRASILIDLAARRWLAGEADDLDRLEPIYVHSVSGHAAHGASGT